MGAEPPGPLSSKATVLSLNSEKNKKSSRPPIAVIKEKLTSPGVSAFIAGGVAGAVSRTVVSPFERMKILFQVQIPGHPSYVGVWPTLKKMWLEEGWRGFMRGNGTNCIRIIPYSAVQYSSYTFYKSLLLNHGERDLDTIRRLSAGALAGITCVVATYPLDIVRTRLSIQTASISARNLYNTSHHKPPLGMWATMKTMYKKEGRIRGLYRGLIPTVMGVAPYVGLNFAVYEYMRDYFTPQGDIQPSAIGKLTAGACSGAVAQTLTYPFDVLRRRFQVAALSDLGYQYKSIWDALSKIVSQEGFFGLYKGLSANLLKVAPSMASSWLTYEFIKDSLQGHHNATI